MEKLTGFAVLDLVMKANKNAEFEQKDITEGHVKVDGFTISERTNLQGNWSSVLIKGNDVRVCRRYQSTDIAKSVDEDLTKYVSSEILSILQVLGIV
jgi:hypothetical protein